MARSSLRDKFKQNLQQKTQESYSSKDANAGAFRDYFDKLKKADTKFYRIPKGDVQVLMDIIPYEAGSKDPKNKKGEATYLLDIEIHRNIGAANEQVVCLAQFNMPCPVCEEVARRRAANEDYETRIKPLKPTRRVAYNVIIRDGGTQEAKGVQVFEIAHFLSEKNIVGISKNPRTGGTTVFSDPDSGKSISFSKRCPTKDTVIYDSFQFCDRPSPITDEELSSAYKLDELIELREYDDIYSLLHNGASDSIDSDDADQDDDSVQEPPEQTATAAEPPARSNRRKERKDENTSGPTCPHGGTLGKDIDELTACAECTMYDECEKVADSM